MSDAVTVHVPASTSNLGAGFDCIGVAVGRWLTVAARRAVGGEKTPAIRRSGMVQQIDLPVERDLVHVGFAAACRAAEHDVPMDLALDVHSEIPIGRGLGSSSSAVVAGAVAANQLLTLALDDGAITELCTEIEGHPDNVAPAVYGGAVLAVRPASGRLTVAALEIHDSLALVFAVPDFGVETRRARAALPEHVEHGTAVAAAARAAALVRGLATAQPALLAAGLDDLLHVPHRRALVAGYDAVTAAAVQAGAYGATLSGSGSTIVAVAPHESAHAVERAMAVAWRDAGITAETFHRAEPVRGYWVGDAPSPGASARPHE